MFFAGRVDNLALDFAQQKNNSWSNEVEARISPRHNPVFPLQPTET